MAGVENRFGQGRPFGQPVFQQSEPGGTATPGGSSSGESRGSARQFVTELIERQLLHVPDVCEYTMMRSGLAALTVPSPIAAESRISVPPAVHQTIVNVSEGLDFVLFHELGKSQRGRGLQRSILRELAELRHETGIDRFVLTHEEGLLVRDAAAVVNVDYDPGGVENTPENIKKRTFFFADLEGSPPSAKVVDATREVPGGK